MLIFDPRKRISVNEALAHPYLANLHCEEDEPESESLSAFDFDFEIYDIKKEDYKNLIFEEIMLYHSEEALIKYINDKQANPNGILHERFGKDKIKSNKQKTKV